MLRTGRLGRFGLFLLLVGVFSCARAPDAEPAAEVTQLTITTSDGAAHVFEVELADDINEQRIGLMHRTSMPLNRGMLFDYRGNPRVVSMWMKNTYIPLDMAFIDSNGVIESVFEGATPHSLEPISSVGPVVAVLEVNGGVFQDLGVQRGDRVIHGMFEER